jgi:hypothetical protein
MMAGSAQAPKTLRRMLGAPAPSRHSPSQSCGGAKVLCEKRAMPSRQRPAAHHRSATIPGFLIAQTVPPPVVANSCTRGLSLARPNDIGTDFL